MVFSETYEVKLILTKTEYDNLCEGLNLGCSHLNWKMEKINNSRCVDWTKTEDRVNSNAERGLYEYQIKTIRELITKIHNAWNKENAIHNAVKALKGSYPDLTYLELDELLKKKSHK